MHMSIGWNELSMPTEWSCVCIPIGITNFKVRGVEQYSVPYVVKVILTHIPTDCGGYLLYQPEFC